MKLQRVKMIIPRQQSDDEIPIIVITMSEEREKPVRKVLLAMLRRLYDNERKVTIPP